MWVLISRQQSKGWVGWEKGQWDNGRWKVAKLASDDMVGVVMTPRSAHAMSYATLVGKRYIQSAVGATSSPHQLISTLHLHNEGNIILRNKWTFHDIIFHNRAILKSYINSFALNIWPIVFVYSISLLHCLLLRNQANL